MKQNLSKQDFRGAVINSEDIQLLESIEQQLHKQLISTKPKLKDTFTLVKNLSTINLRKQHLGFRIARNLVFQLSFFLLIFPIKKEGFLK